MNASHAEIDTHIVKFDHRDQIIYTSFIKGIYVHKIKAHPNGGGTTVWMALALNGLSTPRI